MGFIPEALGAAGLASASGSNPTDVLGGGQGADKYRAQLAALQNRDYGGDISASLADFGKFRGMNEGNAVQQQAFIDQLRAQSMGQGPSIAQQQLAQALNRNAMNQATAASSVRGINPALAAKMSSDIYGHQGADLAQQGATLRAQEQLGAMGQLGGALGQLRQQNLQSQQLSGNLGAQLGGLQNQQNANAIANQMGAQGINAGVAKENVGIGSQIYGGIAKGAASAATGMPMMSGGEQGYTAQNPYNPEAQAPGFAHGGEVNHSHVMAFADGLKHACMMLKGGQVPGHAKVDGDSYQNDTVPAMLSPGEIVVPRSKADDPEAAKKFIEAVEKHHGKKKEKGSYEKVLAAKRKAKKDD